MATAGRSLPSQAIRSHRDHPRGGCGCRVGVGVGVACGGWVGSTTPTVYEALTWRFLPSWPVPLATTV